MTTQDEADLSDSQAAADSAQGGLASELPQKKEMRGALKAEGITWIVIAILVYFLNRSNQTTDISICLGIIIVLGLLNLVLSSRFIFVLNAVVALGMAIPALLVGLTENTVSFQISAVLLAGYGGQQIDKYRKYVPPTPKYKILLESLTGKHEFNRVQAAQELGKLEESNADIVEGLIMAQSDDYESVRQAATAALRAPVHQAIVRQRSK